MNKQSGAFIHKNNSTFWERCGGQAKAATAKHLYWKNLFLQHVTWLGVILRKA